MTTHAINWQTRWTRTIVLLAFFAYAYLMLAMRLYGADIYALALGLCGLFIALWSRRPRTERAA